MNEEDKKPTAVNGLPLGEIKDWAYEESGVMTVGDLKKMLEEYDDDVAVTAWAQLRRGISGGNGAVVLTPALQKARFTDHVTAYAEEEASASKGKRERLFINCTQIAEVVLGKVVQTLEYGNSRGW